MHFVNSPPYGEPCCWFIRPPRRPEVRRIAAYNGVSVSRCWTLLQGRALRLRHPDGYLIITGGRAHAEQQMAEDMEDFYNNM